MKTIQSILGCLLGVSFLLAGTPVLAGDKSETSSKEPGKESSSGDFSLSYMKARQQMMDGKYAEAAPLLESTLKESPENPLLHFQLAEIYLRLNQIDKAEKFAVRAVELDPKNLEYLSTLGGIYASSRKYNEAKAQYAKILELDPTHTKAPLLLGILEAESGNPDKGIEVLNKILDENPDNVMSLFYRAKIYLEQDQIDKAKADLDKCIALRPSFVEAGTALGLIYERQNEIDNAIKTYSRIQSNGSFKKRLAILYLQKNDYEKALVELQEYEQVEKDDYTAKVKIGLIYFELKQFDKAKEKFEAILKVEPNADNVRFYLGWVNEEQKNWTKARSEFMKVKTDSTLFKESMLHVGFILKETEKWKEGTEFSKKLLVKHDSVPEFYDMHASFYEAQKDYKKAMEAIEAGIKKFPKEEKLLYFQGALYDKLNNRPKAIASMKNIIEANPQNAHALNFLGYTYAEMGENLEEAEKYIQRALVIRPNDGFILDSLGWVLFRQGKHDEALVQLEKASTLQPEEAIIQEHLGDVYLAKKEFAKASDTYKRAVALFTKKDKDMAKKIEGKMANIPRDSRVPSAERQ